MREATHCPKCSREFNNKDVLFSRHHVFTRRFNPGETLVIPLCRNCHNEIERHIPTKNKMNRSFYVLVVNNFLGYEAVKYVRGGE